jgi:hypothetical protein
MGAIVTVRAEVAAMLTATGALDDEVVVIPHARNIDAPAVPTVMVRIDAVRPSKAAGGLWELSGALVLVTPKSVPGAGDDDLDDLLSDVLVALAAPAVSPNVHWTEATRGGYPNPDPTNPAYEVAVTIHTAKDH